MSGTGGRSSLAQEDALRLQVIAFTVGAHRLAVPREQVTVIRESPRVRSRLQTATTANESVPLVSLSLVLGLDRDTSVDRRVLEVEHWGQRLGLEVTTIEGIRDLKGCVLHPLPPIAARNLQSRNVLGLLEWLQSSQGTGRKGANDQVAEHEKGPEMPSLAIDLAALLVEQGVEVPDPEAP